jgi:glycosyltransferase involved in cell wall biosynthesis
MNKNNDIPLVTIGLPVHNGGKTIKESLDSLLAQDFKDFELIICDNASTDNTRSICKEYEKLDSRITYHKYEYKVVPAESFNRVLKLARGKYFMWAADDDLWESSFLSCLVDAFNKNPNTVLSFCRFDIISTGCQPIILYDDWLKITGRDTFYRLLHCPRHPGKTDGCYVYGLIDREILVKCGGMEEKVSAFAAQDVSTLFYLLSYGKFIRVDKLLFHKRVNSYRYDIGVVQSITKRLEKQSLYSIFISYLKWLNMIHQFYNMCRTIIKRTPLKISERIILNLAIYKTEIFFCSENILITINNMTKVLGTKISKVFRKH